MSRSTARLLAAATLLVCAANVASAQTIAIVGGTVYPVSGPKLDSATVLIRDGVIAAVGRDVSVPAGATRIDAAGKVVTPGLVHSASRLGVYLFETGGQTETRENLRTGDVNASFMVADAIDPAAVTIPVARMEGITTAVVLPEGTFIDGQAAAIDLDGARVEEMLVRPSAAMVVEMGEAGKMAGGGSRAGTLLRLRQILRDALEYQKRRDEFRRNAIQPLAAPAAELEALLPVLRGELPIYVTADRRADLEMALRLAEEFRLRLVLRGAAEGWQVADAIAAAKVPVVIEPLRDIPNFDAPGARLDNAALLSKAGVHVLFSHDDQAHSRDLRQAAGNAVRNGMSWDAALRAVTLSPAEAFGLADRRGSLAVGKTADVVVWSGDPLELSSFAEHVFIRGRDLPLTSRQTELFERYRKLPPSY